MEVKIHVDKDERARFFKVYMVEGVKRETARLEHLSVFC